MEIKRKLDLFLTTNRRFVIRRAPPGRQIFCAECGAETLTAEQAAVLFAVNQRMIFRLIEKGAAHFEETETGAVMICLPALAALLHEQNDKQQTSDATG